MGSAPEHVIEADGLVEALYVLGQDLGLLKQLVHADLVPERPIPLPKLAQHAFHHHPQLLQVPQLLLQHSQTVVFLSFQLSSQLSCSLKDSPLQQ